MVLAAWIEPSMLGGGFVNLLSNSVESAYTALRYPVVAALSTFVIVLLVLLLVILLAVARRFGDVLSSFRVLKN
jgi:spermidine/putrescine transport system permease protein